MMTMRRRMTFWSLLMALTVGWLAVLLSAGAPASESTSAATAAAATATTSAASATATDRPKEPDISLESFLPSAFDELITADVVREPLARLAADDMNGRAAGSADMVRASDYVADQFKKLGLQPGGPRGSYFQEIDEQQRRVDRTGTHLAFSLPDGSVIKCRLGADFTPFRFSGQGEVDLELAFVGYGISAAEYGYDDYAGIDVKGKLAVMMRYEPGEQDAASKFAGTANTAHATFEQKMKNAQAHGAAGVLIFTGPHYHDGDSSIYGDQAGSATVGRVPILQLNQFLATTLFTAARQDIAAVQEEIDTTGKPQSFVLSKVMARGQVTFRQEKLELRNVLAVLPGTDPKLRDEVVIVGAHLDHIGRRPADLNEPRKDVIFNGADDNASGSAGLLAVARAFAEGRVQPRRSILFMAFDGEEIGLIGSTYYTEHPVWPLEKTALMVNLDMIGRAADHKVTAFGAGGSSKLRQAVESAAKGLGLKVDAGRSELLGTDSTAFAVVNVPALFFFTGSHRDYHRPSDEADKINYDDLAKIARLAARTTRLFADRDAMLPHAVAAGEDHPILGLAAGVNGDNGIVILTVLDDSGAAKAGLKVGDQLLKIDGQTLESVDDVLRLVQKHKVGDTVQVVLKRGAKELTLQAQLGSSRMQAR